MSEWSSIAQVVVIRADMAFNCVLPVMTQEQLDEAVKTIVDAAPRITGSEGDASVFLNRGNDVTTTDRDNDGNLREYRGEYVVTVQGYLRDRSQTRTDAEWRGFRRHLEDAFGADYLDFMTDAKGQDNETTRKEI